MTEDGWLGIISAVMVLVLLVGGIVRRRTSRSESLRLGLLWIVIIAVAMLAVIWVRRMAN